MLLSTSSKKQDNSELKFFFNNSSTILFLDFPDGSVGRESVCDAGDTGDSVDMGLIPGSGRSHGRGSDHSFQYSYLKNPMDRGAWQAIVHGVPKSKTCLSTDVCTGTIYNEF